MFEPIPFSVALNLSGRRVLLIGGGDEAADKLPKLRSAGASVTLVAAQLTDTLAALVAEGACTFTCRAFQASDVQGVHLVMLSEPDPALAAELRNLQAQQPFWLCAIDQPAVSDVYLVSSVTRGPVQIGISTSGKAPLLARRIRRALEAGLDARFSEFARSFADLRARLRALPKHERKQQLEAALNGFAMELRVSYPADHPAGEASPEADKDL